MRYRVVSAVLLASCAGGPDPSSSSLPDRFPVEIVVESDLVASGTGEGGVWERRSADATCLENTVVEARDGSETGLQLHLVTTGTFDEGSSFGLDSSLYAESPQIDWIEGEIRRGVTAGTVHVDGWSGGELRLTVDGAEICTITAVSDGYYGLEDCAEAASVSVTVGTSDAPIGGGCMMLVQGTSEAGVCEEPLQAESAEQGPGRTSTVPSVASSP